MARAKLLLVGIALCTEGCAFPGPTQDAKSNPSISRESYTVSIGGEPVEISSLRSGVLGGRRVIYIHGTPGSADGWADDLADPIEGIEAIAIDRPGFGRSGPGRAVVRLEDQARAIEPLLVEQGGGWPILVGHSLGGPVAAWVAAAYPDRVGGLVLVAASMDPALERVLLIQRVGNAGVVCWILPAWARRSNQELIALESELTLLSDRLSEIRAPIAIVHGTRDRLVPYANVEFMLNAFESQDVIGVRTIEGGNHFLPWKQREEIRSQVRAILRAGDASGL